MYGKRLYIVWIANFNNQESFFHKKIEWNPVMMREFK